jgi:hypothetical protein
MSRGIAKGRAGKGGIVGARIGAKFDVLLQPLEELGRYLSVASLSASVNVLPDMCAPDAPVRRVAFARGEERISTAGSSLSHRASLTA